jgi:hypothetical protein
MSPYSIRAARHYMWQCRPVMNHWYRCCCSRRRRATRLPMEISALRCTSLSKSNSELLHNCCWPTALVSTCYPRARATHRYTWRRITAIAPRSSCYSITLPRSTVSLGSVWHPYTRQRFSATPMQCACYCRRVPAPICPIARVCRLWRGHVLVATMTLPNCCWSSRPTCMWLMELRAKRRWFVRA